MDGTFLAIWMVASASEDRESYCLEGDSSWMKNKFYPNNSLSKVTPLDLNIFLHTKFNSSFF